MLQHAIELGTVLLFFAQWWALGADVLGLATHRGSVSQRALAQPRNAQHHGRS